MVVKLVGRDDVAAGNYESANQLVLTKFTAVATGNMTEFWAKCQANGNIKGAIYSDSAGSPNALLNSMGSTAAVAGWTAYAFPSTPIVSGTVYWLALVVSATSTFGAIFETSVRKYKAWTYADAFPNPAGAGYSDETTWQNIVAGWGTPAGVNWTKSIIDTITISDAISKAASVHKVDAIAIADAISKSVDAHKIDTVVLADTISKAVGVPKSDIITISDTKSHLKSGIGFHNASAQKRYKAATFSTFTFPDPAGIGFTSANDGYYMIAGWGSIGGTVKGIGLFRDDMVAIADAIAGKSVGLNRIDSITITDVFTKASEFYLNLTDTVPIADSFSKTSEFYLSMADTVIISDSAGKAIGISKADLITITEAISKAVGTNKVDTLAIVDIEVKTIGKNLVDLIIITDGFEPIGALFVPPGIYIIEIHDSDGSLVAILEKAYNISLETKTNAPALLTFSIPSDESKLSYLTRARELWVRDYDNKTVITKTKLLRKEDVRD